MKLAMIALMVCLELFAKPYHRPEKIIQPISSKNVYTPTQIENEKGSTVLRVEVSWSKDETYKITGLYLEESGTEALTKSAKARDPLGSYKGILTAGNLKLHSSIGTGREFRQLVRTISLRFPIATNKTRFQFSFEAEHPETGVLSKIFEQTINLSDAKKVETQPVKVTLLRKAQKKPALKFNFYSEGFDAKGEKRFIEAAQKAIAGLEKNLPGQEHFEFKAVFAPSNTKLGRAQDRGAEVKVQDTFLGLYFPHWSKFGRWYHVVYPTSVTKYRNALAQVAYDYPLALVDDSSYWGVGNYKELTAIPVGDSSFTYLLLHEFGHFMGLNEEYEGGGPTELEFASKIHEPWSQNITFNPDITTIKWSSRLEPGISVPTTSSDYRQFGGSSKNPVGAYRGGYADSEPRGKSHKPVMNCMMAAGGNFCPVCQDALKTLVDQDLGL